MLIGTSFSPLVRAAMTMPGKIPIRLISINTIAASSSNIHSIRKANIIQRPQILAALLTTQSNSNASFQTHHASAAIATTSPLRYNNQRHNQFSILGHNNSRSKHHHHRGVHPQWATTLTPLQLAYFSSGPPQPPRGGGKYGRYAGGILGAGALLVGKGKYLLGALKLTKLSSLASMFVTVGAYTMVFGAPFAIGMVGLILVHESGHALVMRHYNIPFSPMVFVPFMGAVIAMKDHPKDAWQDAMIAFGGPALGSAGAAALAVGASATDSQLLYALADFGFMINLFNMLPIGTMDGGRIAGALSPYAGVVGLAMGGGLIATGTIQNPIMYLVMLAGGWSTFQRFYDPAGHRPPHYYNITPTQRGILSGCYFGLIGTLVAGMAANAVNKKPPEEIQRGYKELSFDEREF